MDNLLISVSGIRGVIGKALTADVALRYAAAFGAYLKRGRVVIGRDTRRSGPMIRSAAVAGLLSTGCDVIDIGICPTPTIELAVHDGGFDGGIAVTASHNPDRYNALKFIGPGGIFLSEKQGMQVNRIYEKVRFGKAGWSDVGTISHDDGWIDNHIRSILNLDIISPIKIRRRRLKVAVDCGGGAASLMAERFFTGLGVEYTLIHSEPTIRFPRGPEPIPENLGDLSKAVRRMRADIGFAFDPDADRLAIVSESGDPIGEEYTLALGARYILSRKPGPMVVNLSSSLINNFVADEAGSKLFRTKVGERNVTERLMRIKGAVGGEGNGGLIYPGLHWGRDGFLAAAVILQYLASSKAMISSLVGELPRYVMLKIKLNISRRNVEGRFRSLEKMLPHGKIDNSDGIKISGDDWWLHVRASNTEPVTRVIAEAPDPATARGLMRTARSVLVKK